MAVKPQYMTFKVSHIPTYKIGTIFSNDHRVHSVMSPLSEVLQIIVTGVADVEAIYSKNSRRYPVLEDTYVPDPLEEQLRPTLDNIAAAAFQLLAMVRKPVSATGEAALGVSPFSKIRADA